MNIGPPHRDSPTDDKSGHNSDILSKKQRSTSNSGTVVEKTRTLNNPLPQESIDQQHNTELPRNLEAAKGRSCKLREWSSIRRSIIPHLEIRLITYIYRKLPRHIKDAAYSKCECRGECGERCHNSLIL